MVVYYFHRFLIACSTLFFAWLTFYFLRIDYFDQEIPSYKRAGGAAVICLALAGYFVYYLKTLKKQKEILDRQK